MSNFSQAIKMAIILFPLVALIFTIPYVLHQYHKYGSINSWRTIIIYSFILYMMSAYFLVILPLPSVKFVESLNMPLYNFQPFLFVKDLFLTTGLQINDFATYFPTMKEPIFYEAIFNILLTIPFGIYLHYYFNCSFLKTLFFSFCLTLFFEITQITGLYFIYPRAYRVFDVDDLILNTLGGIIGYFIGSGFLKILPDRSEIDKKSYYNGIKVSLLKRIVSFSIDLTIIFVLTFLWGMLIYYTKITKYFLLLPTVIYFILIIIFKKSVGMAFINLKFETIRNMKYERLAIILYYLFFFLEYVLMPIFMILLCDIFYQKNYFDKTAFEYIIVVIFAVNLMNYIISVLKRIFQMRMLNEYLSGIEIKSTIIENYK